MKKLLLCLTAIANLNCMEEIKTTRPLPPLISELELQKHVVLELVDEYRKVLSAMLISDDFARHASTINNILENTEEPEQQEGKAPIVQLPATSITLEQFKVLQKIVHEITAKDGSLKKAVTSLINNWYPKNLTKLANLLIVANYIDHKQLLEKGIKKTCKIIQKLVVKKEWETLFQFVDQLPTDITLLIREQIPMVPYTAWKEPVTYLHKPTSASYRNQWLTAFVTDQMVIIIDL